MRITIDKYLLADWGERDAALSNVLGFSSRAASNIEIREGVRRGHIKPEDRKNLRHRYTFSVTRRHADVATAEIFVLDQPQSLPVLGVLKFEARHPNGAITRRWLRFGAMESAPVGYTSIVTTHNYNLIGGEMMNTDPEHGS